jgi:hypothetical protein
MNVFVILVGSGSYDSYQETPVSVCFDEDKAREIVRSMTARWEHRMALQFEVTQGMARWNAANPIPVYKEPKLKGLPDFGPKRNKWSSEQLTEYHAVKESNQAKQNAALAPSRDWAIARMDAQDAIIKSWSAEDQQLFKDTAGDESYSYEEVPLVE